MGWGWGIRHRAGGGGRRKEGERMQEGRFEEEKDWRDGWMDVLFSLRARTARGRRNIIMESFHGRD